MKLTSKWLILSFGPLFLAACTQTPAPFSLDAMGYEPVSSKSLSSAANVQQVAGTFRTSIERDVLEGLTENPVDLVKTQKEQRLQNSRSLLTNQIARQKLTALVSKQENCVPVWTGNTQDVDQDKIYVDAKLAGECTHTAQGVKYKATLSGFEKDKNDNDKFGGFHISNISTEEESLNGEIILTRDGFDVESIRLPENERALNVKIRSDEKYRVRNDAGQMFSGSLVTVYLHVNKKTPVEDGTDVNLNGSFSLAVVENGNTGSAYVNYTGQIHHSVSS